MNLPPMVYVIIALVVVYVVIRFWSSRAEEKRRIARDERLAQLFAERENMADPGGETASVEPAAASVSGAREIVKVRCQGCRTLNEESAKTCIQCGAEM